MSVVTRIGIGAAVVGVMAAGAMVGPWQVRVMADTRQQVRPQIISEATVQQEESDQEFGKGAYRVGTEGLVMPKVIRQVDPRYTPEAMRAKVEGVVELEVVVAADGTVEDSRVIKKLHEDLDQQAMDTVAKWEFTPGRLNLLPVRVVIKTQMQFRLH